MGAEGFLSKRMDVSRLSCVGPVARICRSLALPHLDGCSQLQNTVLKLVCGASTLELSATDQQERPLYDSGLDWARGDVPGSLDPQP